MSIAVIRFPGSNCYEETVRALKQFDRDTQDVWYTDLEENFDKYFVPGGFSYGDHLRSGVIAANTDTIEVLKREAANGKAIMGVCNGFQILTESGLLPGALLKNEDLKFSCKWVTIKIEESCSVLSKLNGKLIKIPIAHSEGRFVHDRIEELEENKQVIARYVGNPNGSMNDIAGICSKKGNVMGMMPHPERSMSELLGSKDGIEIIRAFAEE